MKRGRPELDPRTKDLKERLKAVRNQKGKLLTQMATVVRAANQLDLSCQDLMHEYEVLKTLFEREEKKWNNRLGIVKARETELVGALNRIEGAQGG